jgi:hypothetical protein
LVIFRAILNLILVKIFYFYFSEDMIPIFDCSWFLVVHFNLDSKCINLIIFNYILKFTIESYLAIVYFYLTCKQCLMTSKSYHPYHTRKVSKGSHFTWKIFVIILKLLSHELSAWNPKQWKTCSITVLYRYDFHSETVYFMKLEYSTPPTPLSSSICVVF